MGLLIPAHILIRTLPPEGDPNMTQRLLNGNQRSLDWTQDNPYFLFTPEHRNGHPDVQLISFSDDQPLRTTHLLRFLFFETSFPADLTSAGDFLFSRSIA
jgi:hypothetical protein